MKSGILTIRRKTSRASLSPNTFQILREIQTMFDTLEASYSKLDDKRGIDAFIIRLGGFDGNDSYVLRFNRHSGYRNSHMPRIDWYRILVGRWRESLDRANLTRDDILRIIAPCPRG
jgi:uncharacterized protein YfbU (UPF0304 family)